MADAYGDRTVRRVDLPERELFILASGDWRGFRSAACAKEPETAEWLRDVASDGAVFFDIGACVGSYTIIAASLGAQAHAFEPVATSFAHLQQNAWLNGLETVHAWPVALTARTGAVRLELSSPAAGAASHRMAAEGGDTRGAPGPVQRALGFALDDFVPMFGLPQPAHIKIDVDGHEVAVLEGARATLRNVSTVMVEASPETAPSVAVICAAAGLEESGSWPRSGHQRNHLFRRA